MKVHELDNDLADLAEKHNPAILIALARDNEDWTVHSFARTKEDIAAMKVVREWLEFGVLSLKEKVNAAMLDARTSPDRACDTAPNGQISPETVPAPSLEQH